MRNKKTLLLTALSILFLFVPLSTLQAQEAVDPRSGRLSVSATDLVMAAGPVNLEVRRTLRPDRAESGLLGLRWRLNFEKRLTKEKNRVRIEDERGPIFFTQEGNHPEYRNELAGRIRLEKNGQAVWLKTDGTRETFDKEGRLTEIDFRNYNRVHLAYGPDKRLAGIEGPRKKTLKFASDPQGRIVRIESSTGDLITYQYAQGELAQVQVNGALPIRYHYDANGLLVRIEDSSVGSVEMTYDGKGRVLSRRYADGGQEQHKYPGDGNEHETIDSAGGVTKRQWSDDGTREEVTDPLGHKTLIEKNASGLPLSITDPLGNKTTMAYDGQGRLISLKDGAGRTTRFEYLKDTIYRSAIIRPDGSRQINQYDGQMNLTEVRRGNQTIFQQTYYPDGAIRGSKEFGKPEERFTYDQAGRVATQGNALGQQSRFEYDPQGNLIRMTNPVGGVTTFKYDQQKQLISMTDPASATTRYEYDPQGFLSKAVDPAGGIKAFRYDALGRIVSTTSASEQKTQYEYDRLGRMTRKDFPDGRWERFAYDRVGNVIDWTNAQGLNRRFEYDPLGRLIKEKSVAGLEISYSYDLQGNMASWKDNTGGREDFKYDGLGRLTELKTPLGSIVRYSYDPSDRLASTTDALGRVKRFSYDHAGNLSEVAEPEGNIARYTYDYAGRVTAMKHPSGGETRLTFDPLGNVFASVDPLGHTTKRTFDPAGRLRTVSLPQGQTISYHYDPKGLVIEKILPDQKKIRYQYDRDWNPLQIEDGVMTVRFDRDGAGRLTKLDYPHLKITLAYEYNATGLISRFIDAEGRSFLYEYDQASRLKLIKGPDGKTFSFTYDPKDRLKSLTYPNGIRGNWEYDPENRVVRLAYADSNGAPLLGWQYRYDADGNRIEKVDQKGQRIRYRYDKAGQLLEESPEGKESIRYSYSPGGNRAKKEVGVKTILYRLGRGDQLVQAGAETLAYDRQGNVIETKGPGGVRRLVYDPENRLIKVIAPDTTEITYGYGPTGERAWRKDPSGLTTYVTDGVNVQAELREDLRPKVLYLHAAGVDRPLMMTRDGKNYYYHPDATGNIMALTDEQGAVTTGYEYDAFGTIQKVSGESANPLTFSAREFDPATGLYYFRTRYYDPELGRFISKDPTLPDLDRPFSLNPYLYAGNNPLRYIDPFGLDFTPAEQLYIAESDARFYGDMARNPEKYGLPRGAFQNDFLESAQNAQARADSLRAQNRNLMPQRPPSYGSSLPVSASVSGAAGEGAAAGAGSRGNRPGTIQVGAPAGGNRPGTIRVNAPGTGGANVPSSGSGGITRVGGAVGGILGTVGVAVNLQACLDEGRSTAYCYGQFGLIAGGGLVVGGVVVAGAAALGVPATALAVGGAALAGAGAWVAGNRWSEAPETRAQLEQLAAQQAQAEARIKNILANLGGRIGALIDLGKKFCDAQSKANNSALKAKGAAEKSKKEIESTMAGLNAEVAGNLTKSCIEDQTKLKDLPEKIRQAQEWIDKAGQAYPEAIQRLARCASQKDIDDADELLKAATAMGLSGERKTREALADIDALQKSIPKVKEKVKEIREKMSNLENAFLADQQAMENHVTDTETFATEAEAIIARFNTLKAELQQSVSNLTAAIPPQFQADLLALKLKIENTVPPCTIKSQDESRNISKAAKESISGGSLSSLGGIESMLSAGSLAVQKLAIDSALDTCGNLNPPTGQEADNASLALVKLTDKIQGWLKTIADYRGRCLAKLYPKPQTTVASTTSTTIQPSTSTGPTVPPPSPTSPPGSKKLTALAVDCPKQAAVGDTVQCTAVGIYEGDSPTEVTNQVTWTPYTSRFIITRKPESGLIAVAYSYLGFSGTVSIKVVDKTGSGPPVIPPPPPPPPLGPQKLITFVWECYPQQQVRVGGSVQCTALAQFEGESDLKPVTNKATWSPGANFTAPPVKPESGFITVTVDYWGERGTKYIRVVDQTGYDPNQDPGLPGTGKPLDPTIQGLINGFATGLTQGTRPPGPKDPQTPIPQPTDYTKPPGYLSSTTTTTMTTVPPGGTTISTTTAPPGSTTTVTPPTGGTNISGPTKPQQPPTGRENKGPFCDQYARTAVSQNQQNVAQKCGYGNHPRWQSNYNNHYQWCMKEARQGEPEAETSIRAEDLKKCGAKPPTQPGTKPPTTTKPPQPPQPPQQGKNNCVDCLMGCNASFPGTTAANNVPNANCRKGCTVGACFQQCQNNCTRNYLAGSDQKSKCLKQCDDQKNDDIKKLDLLIKQQGGK